MVLGMESDMRMVTGKFGTPHWGESHFPAPRPGEAQLLRIASFLSKSPHWGVSPALLLPNEDSAPHWGEIPIGIVSHWGSAPQWGVSLSGDQHPNEDAAPGDAVTPHPCYPLCNAVAHGSAGRGWLVPWIAGAMMMLACWRRRVRWVGESRIFGRGGGGPSESAEVLRGWSPRHSE